MKQLKELVKLWRERADSDERTSRNSESRMQDGHQAYAQICRARAIALYLCADELEAELGGKIQYLRDLQETALEWVRWREQQCDWPKGGNSPEFKLYDLVASSARAEYMKGSLFATYPPGSAGRSMRMLERRNVDLCQRIADARKGLEAIVYSTDVATDDTQMGVALNSIAKIIREKL